MKKLTNLQLIFLAMLLMAADGGLGNALAAEVAEPHAGHDRGPVTAPPSAPEPLRVPVTQEQVARLGIKINQAVQGVVRQEIRVPGEIMLNSDRVAHVVPRAAGIVREVSKTLGDRVQAGEILAWIESDELAEAKLDFFAKESEVGCCELRLPRSREIFENVTRLTALLRKEGSAEEIRQLEGLEMGKYRGELLPAYAAYIAARTTHQREASLHAKEISSGQELLDAQTNLSKAQAEFQGALDSAVYATRLDYSEAAQARQVAVFNAVASEKRLRLKGVDGDVIAGLRALVPKMTGSVPCPCPDPACKEDKLPSVAETLGKEERFAWYALRAPIAGTVIEKHIVTGESLVKESELFTIADLSSVWVTMPVSQEAISLIKPDYPVTVHLPDGTQAKARTDFIAAVIDSATRTALARATLPNPQGAFRPGTFVDIAILIPARAETVIVPKASVQSVHDHPCVFVWNKGAFEMREVTTGYADANNIEILTGLNAGEAVASVNAFHLKAEVSSSGSAPGCSGHGHAH